MKQFTSILIIIVALALIAAGCGTQKANVSFNKKNQPLPDYVLNSSNKVQETYIMASNYPNVLSQVQCFCGCAADGHKSNLNCFVQKMGPNNTVETWDQHGISCDVCVNIANDAIQMNLSGKKPKEIYQLIKEKYGDLGEGTPTPEPK